jgi:hypothetical protein
MGCSRHFCLLLIVGSIWAAGLSSRTSSADVLPPYQPEALVTGEISSIGDDVMGPLMDAWLAGLQSRGNPGSARARAGNTGATPPCSAR